MYFWDDLFVLLLCRWMEGDFIGCGVGLNEYEG